MTKNEWKNATRQQRLGVVGGFAGSLIGGIGAAVGLYFAIKNATVPEERELHINMAIVVAPIYLIFMVLFLVLKQSRILYLVFGLIILVVCGNIYYAKKLWNIQLQQHEFKELRP